MDPTLAHVLQVFGVFEAVGKTIAYLIKLAKDRATADQNASAAEKLDEALEKLLSGGVKVTLALDEPLIELLRDMGASHDGSQVYWMQSTRGLIRGREVKFEALTELDLTPLAIGTEALANHDGWDAHEDMAGIIAAYLRRYILATPAEHAKPSVLLDSTFSQAIEKATHEAKRPMSIPDMATKFGEVIDLRFKDKPGQ